MRTFVDLINEIAEHRKENKGRMPEQIIVTPEEFEALTGNSDIPAKAIMIKSPDGCTKIVKGP